jgi:LemA protein
MRKLFTVLAALATLSLTNCGYNAIQTQDEQIKANWSEVVNQYQRRADLVPNLVNSVKGFAQQEKDVLLGVTNARAKVGSIQATPEVLNDPAAFQKSRPPKANCRTRCRGCSSSPKTIRSSNPTHCFAI